MRKGSQKSKSPLSLTQFIAPLMEELAPHAIWAELIHFAHAAVNCEFVVCHPHIGFFLTVSAAKEHMERWERYSGSTSSTSPKTAQDQGGKGLTV